MEPTARICLLNKYLSFLIIAAALVLGESRAEAGTDEEAPKSRLSCDAMLLSGDLKAMGSGRDADVFADFKSAAVYLTDLARSLGMSTPPHRMVIVPGSQMNLLASLGRYAAPHWYDGFGILKGHQAAGNILEFVTKGCSMCRSFYSDQNNPRSQISILMHVLGHNDVSAQSGYMQAVAYDPMSSSAAFAARVEQLYEQYDHDEVSLFVQWLFSLESMQDLAFATFDGVDFFAPEQTDSSVRVEHLTGLRKGSVYASPSHPKRPSPNILQAVVANLPPGAAPWKRELIDMFEKTRRFYSGNYATKIMNEGWAVMAQYLLTRHSKYVSSEELLTFGSLMAGVTFAKLDNPYFLGREAWWRLWEVFKARPNIRSLSPFAQDKLFIAYAHEILETHDDYDFLQMALDQEWVNRNNFMLFRPWNPNDSLPPNVKHELGLNIALSRDARRIVRHIQRQVAAKHLLFARVMIEDFNWQHQGVVKLRHDMHEGIPLKGDSALRTMFVLAQVLERPILLEASFTGNGRVAPVSRRLVKPSGQVDIDDMGPQSPLVAAAQTVIDEFMATLRNVVNPDFERSRLDPSWQPALTAMMDSALAPVQKAMLYAPFTDHALLEFSKLVQRQTLRAAREAIRTGQMPATFGGQVLLNVLPDVPHFELDLDAKKALAQQQPPAPVDLSVYTPLGTDQINQDDNSQLGRGPYLPGDVFKGAPKSDGRSGGKSGGQAKGKGKQKGKGEPSDDGDEEGEEEVVIGQNGPPGHGSPGALPVPMEFWGKLLEAELELPNLRRTDGDSQVLRRLRRGSARRPRGYELDDHTIMNALEKAIAARKSKGLAFRIGPELDKRTLLREAILLMDSGDLVVADHMQFPLPDQEAVLVVTADYTGSMAGERVKMAKQLIFNVQALLKAGYKSITIRYVGFSDYAQEFPEEDFLQSFFGGGTSYVSGLKLTKKILDEYDNRTHNKFVLLIGDAESNDAAESIALLNQMAPDLQYFSFAVTKGPHGAQVNPFVNVFQGYKKRWPWIGIADLRTQADVIPSLKKLFPKDEGQQP